jgi:azurin
MWPKELQGGYIKVRYKPTNRVEMHQWIEKDDHYQEKYMGDVLFSTNLSFIPVDVRFGPTGALYVCDWYNPVKGHAQYALRDPRRDRTSGRIWRIVPKGAALQQAPAIADAPIPDLLDNLKRAEYRYRYWSKREIRTRDVAAVASALDQWVAKLDKQDPRFRHHQIEAIWTYRTIGVERPALLAELITCEEHHARAAATQQLRYWHAAFADDGLALLSKQAHDANARVRMEAVTAASYIGTRAAIDAIMPVMHSPMDTHLRYATICAFGSEYLRRHWEQEPALASMINSFIKPPKTTTKTDSFKEVKHADDVAFDKHINLAVFEISSVPERMLFTPTQFTVKSGQPVKLIFSNPDAMQHNLVIVKPGAMEEIGMAGNEMAKDPNGIKANFVPKSDKILCATKLVDPHEGEVLRFLAPMEPGVYPFVCTFPGHWIIMNGKMTVE